MSAADRWDSLFAARSPAFAPLREFALDGFTDFPDLGALNALIQAHGPVYSGGGAPLSAIAPPSRARDWRQGYEPRIYRHGQVGTRAGSWHDLFNLLVWLRFPRTKARLNALHYREIERNAAQPGANRTRAQDVLTLFDEGGLVVVARAPEWLDLIRRFQWRELFWQRRDALQANLHFHLFGHALYEKLLHPYAGLTAKAILIHAPALFELMPAAYWPALDRLAAERWADPALLASSRTLAPVPFLGYPGWDAANEDPRYYDNSDYFRAGWRRA